MINKDKFHQVNVVTGKSFIIWDPLVPNKKRDNIDTDQITPADDCISIDMDDLDEPWKAGAFRHVIPYFREKVHNGNNFLIVGERFGIGSSREMSPAALKGIAEEANLEMIIVCSNYLGDIFRRNAINLGLHLLECPEAVNDAKEHDEFSYDKEKRLLTNKTQNITYQPKPLTEKEQNILATGGIINIGRSELKNSPQVHIAFSSPSSASTLSLTEQILWSHRVDKDKPLKQGETIRIFPDLLPASDGTAPLGIYTFNKIIEEKKHIKPKNVAIINDHFVFTHHESHKLQAEISRKFATQHHIEAPYFSEAGGGIFHFYLPENKLIQPGGIYAGADSHSRTYGAYGALGIGIGSTTLGFGWATGWIYFTVPKQNRIIFKGQLPPWVTGKDIILALLKKWNSKLHNSSIEIVDADLQLPMSYRHTITNMMAEAEVTNAIFQPDMITHSWFADRDINLIHPSLHLSDASCFEHDEIFDLSELELQVARPYHPGNSIGANELAREKIKFNKAMIGSCTNGSYDDLYKAALIFYLAKNQGYQHIYSGTQFFVYPGSREVKKQIYLPEARLQNQSIADIFINVGGEIRESWCGPCFGQGPDALKAQEVAITTFNRNWQNRMGVGGIGYLSSPIVVASSALLGHIGTPTELGINWHDAKNLFG